MCIVTLIYVCKIIMSYESSVSLMSLSVSYRVA